MRSSRCPRNICGVVHQRLWVNGALINLYDRAVLVEQEGGGKTHVAMAVEKRAKQQIVNAQQFRGRSQALEKASVDKHAAACLLRPSSTVALPFAAVPFTAAPVAEAFVFAGNYGQQLESMRWSSVHALVGKRTDLAGSAAKRRPENRAVLVWPRSCASVCSLPLRSATEKSGAATGTSNQVSAVSGCSGVSVVIGRSGTLRTGGRVFCRCAQSFRMVFGATERNGSTARRRKTFPDEDAVIQRQIAKLSARVRWANELWLLRDFSGRRGQRKVPCCAAPEIPSRPVRKRLAALIRFDSDGWHPIASRLLFLPCKRKAIAGGSSG